MKKKMIAFVVACMSLTGCGMGVPVSGPGMEIASSMELEDIEKIEQSAIKELTNSWPESVSYDANGVYANPLVTSIEITDPMTLTLSCVTMDGSLRLKIVNQDTYEVCLNEKNPDGEYTVSLDGAGTYLILFYAKEHVGSVEIVPCEN